MGQLELQGQSNIMKKVSRIQKHLRVRKHLLGTTKRPRLCVFRSSQHIYAQIIDDSQSKTLVSASDTKEIGVEQSSRAPRTKKEKAYETGKNLAQKAIKLKIKEVVFDRGGFLYQGRVEELARGAREGGLKF